ncbi:MAG: HAD-IIA family hydrolase [Actinomycetaceae bacterium]|nr:HAD-IIA family hydrolase [Actinomycetaceae bacterium]
MAGQLIDLDPERAYVYAQAAVKRAGRVDIVREAAALTAYATGRFQEALREVRAVRRMRGDFSLRAVEADSERGLGKPEKALELIEETDLSQVDLGEQVELVLVAGGARADMGEHEAALVLVDNALTKLGDEADDEYVRRLMSAKADHLRSLGRSVEASEVEAAMPAEEEDNDILDLKMMAESDVDDLRSDLKGSEEPLSERYDTLVLDLDGVCYMGKDPVPHAAQNVSKAIEGGMKHVFVTNNSSRTPQSVAQQLIELGFPTDADHVMTSAMDAMGMMQEDLEPGDKVFVIGGQGLKNAVSEAGFVLAESADEKPVAVVQGLDKSVDWHMLSEGALAINAGAKFYATNLDASLPVERGFALGNGALVRAVRYATNTKPKASGKPLPGIFEHAIEMVGGEHAIAIGDRLETDVAGALAASIPSMHVLTGVHDAKDVILADRGLRPQLVHLDMRGVNEPHPRPRHHKDGTWTCGVSQEAKVVAGRLTLDGVFLPEEGATVTLDSYRALIAAAWDHAKETDSKVYCPPITVVENDDPAGVLEPIEPEESEDTIDETFDTQSADDAVEATETPEDVPAEGDEMAGSVENADMPSSDISDEDLANVDVEGVPEFLPGEEDLAELMEETKHLESKEQE